jgi:ubiquinone/menaquinone biosynthesis C-methylase UbiE
VDSVVTANDEAIEAWNGVLFDRFLQYRHVLIRALEAHGERALERLAPQPGERVLDVGCGFGDASQRIAGLVGPEGSVLGVDAATRFIEAARAEAAQAGSGNVRFEAADVEGTHFDETFDAIYARFGTMFFANPVAAFRNLRAALVPGGRLSMVVWRRKLDNEWMYRAEQVVEQFVTHNEESDEPTCGPGPFSMAGADTTSEILKVAGFEEIELRRCDLDVFIGEDLPEAVDVVMALGPAGEVLRLAGDDAERIRPKVTAALEEALAGFTAPDGMRSPSSSWIVSARAPG